MTKTVFGITFICLLITSALEMRIANAENVDSFPSILNNCHIEHDAAPVDDNSQNPDWFKYTPDEHLSFRIREDVLYRNRIQSLPELPFALVSLNFNLLDLERTAQLLSGHLKGLEMERVDDLLTFSIINSYAYLQNANVDSAAIESVRKRLQGCLVASGIEDMPNASKQKLAETAYYEQLLLGLVLGKGAVKVSDKAKNTEERRQIKRELAAFKDEVIAAHVDYLAASGLDPRQHRLTAKGFEIIRKGDSDDSSGAGSGSIAELYKPYHDFLYAGEDTRFFMDKPTNTWQGLILASGLLSPISLELSDDGYVGHYSMFGMKEVKVSAILDSSQDNLEVYVLDQNKPMILHRQQIID